MTVVVRSWPQSASFPNVWQRGKVTGKHSQIHVLQGIKMKQYFANRRQCWQRSLAHKPGGHYTLLTPSFGQEATSPDSKCNPNKRWHSQPLLATAGRKWPEGQACGRSILSQSDTISALHLLELL